jgi:hypothetical protein
MPRGLLNLFPLIIVAIQIKNVRHQIKRILVVLDLCIQTRQVEPIGQIVFVDFAKVLVASRGYKLILQSVTVPLYAL